jgi:hypothetical protein
MVYYGVVFIKALCISSMQGWPRVLTFYSREKEVVFMDF